MITIGWEELAEHQEKGDSAEWLEGKIKADKERQLLEDLFGVRQNDCHEEAEE